MADKSLQETYAPQNACFGCGPANERGLHIRSFAQGDEVVADWTPEPHHAAFEGILNGGIIGTLLDCHSNWTAVWHFIQAQGLDGPPSTVTSEYSIKLHRPTPTDSTLRLVATVVEASERRATVEGKIIANGEVTATSVGTFVIVQPGHPAYRRW